MSYRNPYLIRASETVESDDIFIRLLSPEPMSKLIDLNQRGSLWGKTLYIRSSPGGGKTTLLRLFGPSVLHKITNKQDERELYHKLSKLDVKDGEVIKKVGVYSLMSRDFSLLEDDELFTPNDQKRVFYALLNVRILLATIKSLAILCSVSKDDLYKIKYCPPDNYDTERIEGKNAQELLEWAQDKETQIITALDEYESACKVGHNSLFVFDQIKASYFYYNDQPVCEEFIFQLDDAHKLSALQKSYLREEVIEKRRHVTIWIAERLESLTTSEILADINIPKRDYEEIRLDDQGKGMLVTLKRIAELRSSLSSSGLGLTTSLAESYQSESNNEYKKIIEKYKIRLSKYPNLSMVESWMPLIDGQKTKRESVMYYRALLIYLSRKKDEDGIQMRLFPYEADDMADELKTYLVMSEKIIDFENKLVAYYGEQTLYDIASNNIEQFLEFSSAMYNLLLSKKLSSPDYYDLSPNDQDRIYRDECRRKFDEMRRLKGAEQFTPFLNNLMNYFVTETYTDSFSYRVVSGFAVQEENSKGFWFEKDENKELAEVLRLCLAYNLLCKSEITQGTKNQKWSVFYLNRWLCVYCGIPFERGGWHKISTKKLKSWL